MMRRGRSPRVRGRPAASLHPPLSDGSIPACAGKTQGRGRRQDCRAVDPRVCGEDAAYDDAHDEESGRSPRVRGRQGRRQAEKGLPWSIPACAGKTGFDYLGRSVRQVDPRVCGEDGNQHRGMTFYRGRSPRVRGRHLSGRRIRRPRGSIPACAGKTIRSGVTLTNCWVDPRVCGEDYPLFCSPFGCVGRSPRVRGRPMRPFRRPFQKRSIPACAGKTNTQTVKMPAIMVDPRVCGEDAEAGRQH